MATKDDKKTEFTRKKPKRYPMVEFTIPDVYDDAVFRLPELSAMPIKVQRRGMKNDIEPLFDVCRTAGVDEATLAAMDDLDQEEYGDFMQAWSKAGTVPAGKSGA